MPLYKSVREVEKEALLPVPLPLPKGAIYISALRSLQSGWALCNWLLLGPSVSFASFQMHFICSSSEFCRFSKREYAKKKRLYLENLKNIYYKGIPAY